MTPNQKGMLNMITHQLKRRTSRESETIFILAYENTESLEKFKAFIESFSTEE